MDTYPFPRQTERKSTYKQMHLLRYCLYTMEEQICFSYNIDIPNPFWRKQFFLNQNEILSFLKAETSCQSTEKMIPWTII